MVAPLYRFVNLYGFDHAKMYAGFADIEFRGFNRLAADMPAAGTPDGFEQAADFVGS